MALTDTDIKAAFDEEAGDAATMAVASEVRRWWNEGQSRLGLYTPLTATITWALAATQINLPADFVSVMRVIYPQGVSSESWSIFGRRIIFERPEGAARAGTVTLHYWAERAALISGGTSIGTAQEDYACIYYALHRFFRKLASNRVQFKRYSTLLGANAVSVADLQAESDRLLQDFRDARDDLPVMQPSGFYGG